MDELRDSIAKDLRL